MLNKKICNIVNLINYINNHDGSIRYDFKFLNDSLYIISKTEIGMSQMAVSLENIDNIISTLQFRKDILQESTITVDEGYEEEHLQDAYNV